MSRPRLAHLAATLLVASILVLPSIALAQVPTTFNYQGRLLENTAEQDAVMTDVDIVFSIWSDPAGGTELWTESWTGVPLTNGIFSVLLGSNGSPLDPADFQGDTSLYLELRVDGETLTPRQMLGSAPFAVVDEPENELQDLDLTDDTLSLSRSAETVDLSPYLDDSDDQDLSLTDNTLSLEDDPTPVDLSPYLDNTDDQDLSRSGNSLILENDATPVDLSPYLDNTDVQDLSRTGDTISLTNDGTPVDVSDLSQTLSLSGDTLTISDGNSVDLGEAMEFSSLSNRVGALEDALTRTVFVTSQQWRGSALGGLAGADAKCQAAADSAGLDGVFLAWLSDSSTSPAERFDRLGSFDLPTGANVADNWADLTDGTLDRGIDTDESGSSAASSFAWTGTETDGTASANVCDDWSDSGIGLQGVAIETASQWTENGGANCDNISASLYCIEQVALGRDNQQLALAGNVLTLTSDDGVDSIDLTPYLDDTDTDNQVLSLSGNTLTLTSDDGNDTVNLAGYLDNTDNQALSLSGNTLTLTSDDGNDTIDLSAYLDNTDTQDLSLSGNTLSLTNGGSVSLAAFKDNTDTQDLSLSGNTLNLTNGGSVSLAAFKDNTDNQDIASVLSNGTNAGDRDLTNLDDVDIDKLTVDSNFECDADSANCIESSHIERDTILGNDITDRIFINWIDCNGNCNDMSMRDACDVIENLRGLDFEVELMGVSCVHSVPSTEGNQFVDCDDGDEIHGDNECRAFELRTLGDLPCVNGDGTDVIVTCYQTDIPK